MCSNLIYFSKFVRILLFMRWNVLELNMKIKSYSYFTTECASSVVWSICVISAQSIIHGDLSYEVSITILNTYIDALMFRQGLNSSHDVLFISKNTISAHKRLLHTPCNSFESRGKQFALWREMFLSLTIILMQMGQDCDHQTT